MNKICLTISLFHASTCFEHHVLIVRRSKLYYTASGIITPTSVMIYERKVGESYFILPPDAKKRWAVNLEPRPIDIWAKNRPLHWIWSLWWYIHWYRHTYRCDRCDGTRGCIIQFWPRDDEHMCSKHVEAWNKLIVKQILCIKLVNY